MGTTSCTLSTPRAGGAACCTGRTDSHAHRSWEQYKKAARFRTQRAERQRKQLINHMEFNQCLVTKKVPAVAMVFRGRDFAGGSALLTRGVCRASSRV